jgi:hypothetical protein
VPKKLQIKLLSDAGELLNVVTCSLGNISVFRAHSPTDLRPYQRALAGVPTKERFVLVVDGDEYLPAHHTVIGFGEGPFKDSTSTRDYLVETGCSEESVDGLLMSLGLERYADAALSTLPADEERRVRILAATLHPERALIINEPFEPISSQWRERAADILASFARGQNALIVVPSLSYRPESWIDNQAVARIQVGQTLQRTIGFGAAGSAANSAMDELKNRVRAEVNEKAPEAASVALGAALTAPLPNAQDVVSQASQSRSTHTLGRFTRHTSLTSLQKTFVATGGLLAVSAAMYALMPSSDPVPSSADTKVVIAPEVVSPSQNETAASLKQPEATGASSAGPQAEAPQRVDVPPKRIPLFVLDFYPEPIRDSLLATTRGVQADSAVGGSYDSPTQSPALAKNNPGNIFNLLEQASSSDMAQPPKSQQWAGDEEPAEEPLVTQDAYEDPVEAEQRREAIRQKFLEAIRAAAERRESEMASGE